MDDINLLGKETANIVLKILDEGFASWAVSRLPISSWTFHLVVGSATSHITSDQKDNTDIYLTSVPRFVEVLEAVISNV